MKLNCWTVTSPKQTNERICFCILTSWKYLELEIKIQTFLAEMFFIDQEITYTICKFNKLNTSKTVWIHLVPTKFYQWNECFARSLWSLATLWDHFVLKGCKSHCSCTTLTLKWPFFHFIHKKRLVQDIILNMVAVFMSLFLVLLIFFLIFQVAKS